MTADAPVDKAISELVADWLGSLGRQATSMGANLAPEFLTAGVHIIEALGPVRSQELSGADLVDFLEYSLSRRVNGTTMAWMLADVISYGVQQNAIPINQDHAPFMLRTLKIGRPHLTVTNIESADPSWLLSRMENDEFEREHQRGEP